jgi:hypothetical protein
MICRLCSRPFIAHIDEEGRAGEVFVVSQKDVEFYHLLRSVMFSSRKNSATARL